MPKPLAAIGALALAVLAGAPAAAHELDRTEVETIVREYLNENPSVIYEAVERHQQRLAAEAEARRGAAIAANYETLVEGAPTVGAGAAAAVTVVEFLDYNCGYCKRAMAAVLAALETESDVRFVFIEYPILAESSRTAALAALAAERQGRYLDLHRALMEHRGALTDTRVMEIAEATGLDVERLRSDMDDGALAAALERNAAAAQAVGIQGTPFFLINREAYPGALDEEMLRTAISTARAG